MLTLLPPRSIKNVKALPIIRTNTSLRINLRPNVNSVPFGDHQSTGYWSLRLSDSPPFRSFPFGHKKLPLPTVRTAIRSSPALECSFPGFVPEERIPPYNFSHVLIHEPFINPQSAIPCPEQSRWVNPRIVPHCFVHFFF